MNVNAIARHAHKVRIVRGSTVSDHLFPNTKSQWKEGR